MWVPNGLRIPVSTSFSTTTNRFFLPTALFPFQWPQPLPKFAVRWVMESVRRFALFIPLLLLVGLVAYLHLRDPLQRGFAHVGEMKVKRGDDPSWAEPDLDTADWVEEIPHEDAPWWLRAKVAFADDPPPFQPRAFSFQVAASYELYWDGVLIGRNGKVGTGPGDEIHGNFHRIFIIPDRLAGAGGHDIAMRLSSFDGKPLSMDWPRVGDQRLLWKRPLLVTAFFQTLAGGFLTIAIYFLFIYLISYRHRAFLIFSALCLCIFLLLIAELMRLTLDYVYPLQFTRLFAIVVITTLVAYLLPLFLLVRFAVPWKRRAAFAIALAFGAIWAVFANPDWRTLALVALSFAASFSIALWALAKRRDGSREACLGVAACLIGLGYPGISIFIGLGMLVLYTLLSLAIQLRAEREARTAALTRSLQLETNLLKSRIHPHFLMNTLTSLISWVEESPKVAVTFIEALGKEFELLNQVANRKLIPLAVELALRENHLAIMRLRQEVDYRLHREGLDMAETVPPALFNTLLENGITHDEPKNGRMAFHLNCTREGKRRIYTFTSGIPNGRTRFAEDSLSVSRAGQRSEFRDQKTRAFPADIGVLTSGNGRLGVPKPDRSKGFSRQGDQRG